MSISNILPATLIASLFVAGLVLFTGPRAAEAGIFQTPAGGWGIDRPAPTPDTPQAPRDRSGR